LKIIRILLIILGLYFAGYIALRASNVLYYDQYAFFRDDIFGRYHISPNRGPDNELSILMWYFYRPIHIIEHIAWTGYSRIF
jgi:hypothetical protein